MMNTTAPVSVEEQARPKRLNFSDAAQREAHVQAFLAWLPPILHTAPGIEWERLPSRVMGYFIRTVADDPDAIPLAFAAGCTMDAMRKLSLYTRGRAIASLLHRLRTQYGMSELVQLGTRDIWDRFVEERTLEGGDLRLLIDYHAVSSTHIRVYLEGLNVRDRVIWEQYALPPLPASFMEKHKIRGTYKAAAALRRKEQSDVLVPLFPLLVELAQLRKQAAERLIKQFRQYRDRASTGEITLPFQFQYTDHLFEVSTDASTLSAVELTEREVMLSFTLWDRLSWVKEHWDQCSVDTRKLWERQKDAYAPERNTYFLQYEGKAEDLLWCGDLITTRQLGQKHRASSSSQEQGDMALRGALKSFYVSRSGLLSPAQNNSHWFNHNLRADEVIFDPESLYRGALYATALATVALTNGSRVSELLQISANRFETLAVDELKDRQPTGCKIGILVQHLLPKGSTRESDRQFFLISEMAGRLLREIGQLLETTHGGSIPIVQPYENSKEEDLAPEPYLFQWAASDDGRHGLLTTLDVGRLLRFLFHGLTFTTRTGKPIHVATHLLRHVLATHARQVKNVPAEAVAYLLHHRVTIEGASHAISIPEATAYYSRMPVERLLALLFEAQAQFSPLQKRSYLQVPPPRTLQQMEAALRQVFEQWGTIGPTVLGYCSAGLCIRPNNRALCLGCPYLVPHYSNLRNAKTWRKLHVLQVQLHDAHGHSVDAEQSRQMIQHLDDIIRVMEVQIRTRQDGGYLPFADTLPPAPDEEGETQ